MYPVFVGLRGLPFGLDLWRRKRVSVEHLCASHSLRSSPCQLHVHKTSWEIPTSDVRRWDQKSDPYFGSTFSQVQLDETTSQAYLAMQYLVTVVRTLVHSFVAAVARVRSARRPDAFCRPRVPAPGRTAAPQVLLQDVQGLVNVFAGVYTETQEKIGPEISTRFLIPTCSRPLPRCLYDIVWKAGLDSSGNQSSRPRSTPA